MPSHVDWYLVELGRLIADFPEDRREILMVEVESHLREQADEMVAAGMNGSDADREAVRVFGEPLQFADRLRDEVAVPTPAASEASLRGSVNALVGLVASLVMFVCGISFLGPVNFAAFMGWNAICVGVLILGVCSARRITLASMLAGIVLGGAAASVALGFTFVDYGALDGYQVSPVMVAYDRAGNPVFEYESRMTPGLSTREEAERALAQPVYARALGFSRFGYIAAIAGAGVLFAAWGLRHASRKARQRRRYAPRYV